MSMKLYKSYMFRNKDPAIDELRTVMQDVYGHRGITYATMTQVEINGGPTYTTLHNWFYGKTRRPQNATLEAAGRALGYRRVWVKNNDKEKK